MNHRIVGEGERESTEHRVRREDHEKDQPRQDEKEPCTRFPVEPGDRAGSGLADGNCNRHSPSPFVYGRGRSPRPLPATSSDVRWPGVPNRYPWLASTLSSSAWQAFWVSARTS